MTIPRFNHHGQRKMEIAFGNAGSNFVKLDIYVARYEGL